MDRFVWYTDNVNVADSVFKVSNVCLYDGDDKTAFERGTLILHETYMVWIDSGDYQCKLKLELNLILSAEKHHSLFRSDKVIVTLNPCPTKLQGAGPVSFSSHSDVKLSFRDGGHDDFFNHLMETLKKKAWEHVRGSARAGIVGIERRLEETHTKTSRNIHQSFEDLSKLMNQARHMVELSKSISEKIRLKQGDITEDETVRFKAHLLSLGIDDPVTKESHGSGDAYYRELARQIAGFIEGPIGDAGGFMVLSDVYCRINRARGLELISPDDLLNACQMLNRLSLPVRFHTFDSGVSVLMLASESLSHTIEQTEAAVVSAESLSAEEYSQSVGIPVILAKEKFDMRTKRTQFVCRLAGTLCRDLLPFEKSSEPCYRKLLCAENSGALCRDESVEGLRFFPNRFTLAESH